MLKTIHRYIVPAAYSLLPGEMDSDRATAMLLAIGLQESGFEHRYQIPVAYARGFWQFEQAGLHGVIEHRATSDHLTQACYQLGYHSVTSEWLHPALQHNDILACVCARLLLWTIPQHLPEPDDPDRAWNQYLRAWRPGKPRPEEWRSNYGRAWSLVGSIASDGMG